jgi:hypothetical protein
MSDGRQRLVHHQPRSMGLLGCGTFRGSPPAGGCQSPAAAAPSAAVFGAGRRRSRRAACGARGGRTPTGCRRSQRLEGEDRVQRECARHLRRHLPEVRGERAPETLPRGRVLRVESGRGGLAGGAGLELVEVEGGRVAVLVDAGRRTRFARAAAARRICAVEDADQPGPRALRPRRLPVSGRRTSPVRRRRCDWSCSFERTRVAGEAMSAREVGFEPRQPFREASGQAAAAGWPRR